jgi:hypothetical protein
MTTFRKGGAKKTFEKVEPNQPLKRLSQTFWNGYNEVTAKSTFEKVEPNKPLKRLQIIETNI